MEIFVDTMSNDFCQTFKAWPAGCYVLSPTRQLLFIGAPKTHEIFFDIESLFHFLRKVSLADGSCPECSGTGIKSGCLPNISAKRETCPLCKGDGSLWPVVDKRRSTQWAGA